MKAFEYYAPAALEEAFDLLDRFEAEGKLLNGGTDVVIQLREKLIAPKAVIDIKRIPGLRGIGAGLHPLPDSGQGGAERGFQAGAQSGHLRRQPH